MIYETYDKLISQTKSRGEMAYIWILEWLYDQKPRKRSRKSQLFRLGKDVRLWRQKGLNFKWWFIKSDFLLSWAICPSFQYLIKWIECHKIHVIISFCHVRSSQVMVSHLSKSQTPGPHFLLSLPASLYLTDSYDVDCRLLFMKLMGQITKV